ncbi:MAG: protein-disulfide reductase DsbD domain-containing protein, partial [Pseudoxanthomonas sp.]
MSLLPRLLSILFLTLLATTPALAVSEADLLPVDQAFALTAKASSRDRIDVQWKVADGYYLYRHRTSVEVEGPGFEGAQLQLPKGKAYRDEFFGDVETYHQDLNGVLIGKATENAQSITLKVKYQGCADAGICYPPQTRKVVVQLPAPVGIGVSGSSAITATTNAGGLPLFGQPAASNGSVDALPLPHDKAFAFEAISFDGNQLLLRFTPAPGYYVYRDRTTLKLQGTPGITLASPRWPKGQPYRDEHFGEVVVYFDQAEVPVPLNRTTVDAANATLQVTFQGCQKDGICYPPMTRAVKLAIPEGRLTTNIPEAPAPALITPLTPAQGTPDPTAAGTQPPSSPESASEDPAQVGRTTPPADVLRNADSKTSLWLALLLALGGGLVLNLMPCVLPVLSLKALSLADSGRNGGHARASALWYTAGVLLSFVALGALAIALRAAGQALGWGFQLQQPLVIGGLVYLMFAVGLSLSGVFALGHRFAGAGHELTGRSGPAGDFFTGVLAVVIASPCTAPFMGAALAFAFTASTPVALLVFACLGLGLALPFLLIGFVPGLAQRLPRPGAWMETLKHFLAFPMYLTVAWLLWV